MEVPCLFVFFNVSSTHGDWIHERRCDAYNVALLLTVFGFVFFAPPSSIFALLSPSSFIKKYIIFQAHMVIGNFVEPWLFGGSFELSPVVVLLSLAFWGSLWVGTCRRGGSVNGIQIIRINCCRFSNIRTGEFIPSLQERNVTGVLNMLEVVEDIVRVLFGCLNPVAPRRRNKLTGTKNNFVPGTPTPWRYQEVSHLALVCKVAGSSIITGRSQH